jgi:formate hydrogenlyase transcriptional activator
MPDTPRKSVMVSGASGGIGRAVATRLARDGFAVRADTAGLMPLSPIANGALERFDTVIATNLDDRKRAEARLRHHEQELRRIIDAIPQAIVVLGPEGRNLYANQAVLEYTGLTLDEVMAADFRARVFHPDDVARLHDERQEALARGLPFANEQRARRHDGQYRWFLIQYSPLRDDQGRLLRWYATGTDIDERKQVEERIRHENLVLREDLARASMCEEIVGSSAALRRVLAHAEKVAGTEATVLILGETGTGKELMTRAIHQRSPRRRGPLSG